MSDDHLFCTFFVQGLYFGVEVQKVQEVLRYQPMTRVPLASAVVRGLINLRGQIVTAIDMRHRLGLSPREENDIPMNVVLRADGGAVALLVDEIGDVIRVDQRDFEYPPETLGGVARDLVVGIYKLDQQLLLVLDTARTIAISALTGQPSS